MENFEQETSSVQREKPNITATIDALHHGSDAARQGSVGMIPSADVFYGLSDLTKADIEQLKPVWASLDEIYRAGLLRTLVETSESNYELNYRALALLSLRDLSPNVRQVAIELLWEDESLEFMRTLMSLAEIDPHDDVRAVAARELGRFILAGELGDLPESETVKAQSAVLRIYNNDTLPVQVRRRALEAISNSSHDEVTGAIRKAYRSADRDLQVSAIFAMGRSCDSEEWEEIVLSELESEDPEKRFEAARAAGELTLFEAVSSLSQLTLEDDREVQEAAIWSLGEIGGKEALRVLNALLDVAEKKEDDALVELIEDAIGSASLVDGSFLGLN